MNVIYFLLHFLLVVSVFTPSTSLAQDQVDKVDREQGYRMTLFNEWKGPDLYVRDKQDYELLKIHQMAYTRVFRLNDKRMISLYTKFTKEDGQVAFRPLLNIQTPEAIVEPLLLLYWNASSKQAKGKVIEFSPSKFRYGSYQVVNIGSPTIIGYIGSKKNSYTCKGGSAYISSFEIKQDERTPITAYTRGEDEQLSLVYSTMTIHREKKRVILFLYPERNKLERLIYRSQSLVDFSKIK